MSGGVGRRDPLSEATYLWLVGVLGLVGWWTTAAVATWPTVVARVAPPSTAVVCLWACLSLGMYWVGATRTVAPVRSNWMLGVWIAASVAAIGINAATLTRPTVPWQPYGLVHPWLAVYVLGYLAQSVEVDRERRLVYLAGAAVGAVVVAVTVGASVPWPTLFVALGLVHVLPLAADAAMLRADLVAPTTEAA